MFVTCVKNITIELILIHWIAKQRNETIIKYTSISISIFISFQTIGSTQNTNKPEPENREEGKKTTMNKEKKCKYYICECKSLHQTHTHRKQTNIEQSSIFSLKICVCVCLYMTVVIHCHQENFRFFSSFLLFNDEYSNTHTGYTYMKIIDAFQSKPNG